MKLYLALGELSLEDYAKDVRLFGIFDTEEQALRCIERNEEVLKDIFKGFNIINESEVKIDFDEEYDRDICSDSYYDGPKSYSFWIDSVILNESSILKIENDRRPMSGSDVTGGFIGISYYE